MLKAGIVGLPNVGKSTLFNAVTRTRKAHAANFPFCTIEPNLGIVSVPDERLEKLAALGVPSFACTPDAFPGLMAAAIRRDDISSWAATQGIVTSPKAR